MHRPSKILIAAVALLALLGAQVFGLQRGYVCDCGGVAKQTTADHCHGPHSSICHDHESDEEDQHPSGQESRGADTHEHAPHVEFIKVAKQDPGGTAPQVILLIIAELPWDSPVLLPKPQELSPRHIPHADRSPPECLRVTRSVVLLI